MASIGTRIFLDDGLIELVVKFVGTDELVCNVVSSLGDSDANLMNE